MREAHRCFVRDLQEAWPKFAMDVDGARNDWFSSRIALGRRPDAPDLIVNDEVVVEIKSVERYDPVCLAQMLTYLRITEKEVGLIINFNCPRVVDGIKRVAL